MKAACKDCSGECAHASGSERDKQIYSSRGRKGAGDIQDILYYILYIRHKGYIIYTGL